MKTHLALLLYQAGASEIYVDGEPAARFGTVGTSIADEIPFQSRSPHAISLAAPGRHVIAIRYSNFSAAALAESKVYTGFDLSIGTIDLMAANRVAEISENLTRRMIFAVVPLTLALLHLILFAFYRRMKGNLYYSLCMIGFSGIVFCTTQNIFTTSLSESVFYVKLAYVAENVAIIFGLLMMYTFAHKKIPVHGFVIIGAGAALGLCAFVELPVTAKVQDAYLLLVIAEMIRCTIFGQSKSRDGSWILAVGMFILIITLIVQLLIAYGVIDPIAGLTNGYLYGALALSIAMSIYLSRRFAQTHFDLETQVVQIKELSVRALDQERQARESEIQQRLLEADNKRKTNELEEARKVQLSMLPSCLNNIPGYDICFSMRTATEIGGDYYDYAVSPDGTLHVVIGDATGHGMKSALMVATMKSMFSTIGSTLGITDFFGRCTEIIKEMNLGNLFMSMTFLRLKDHAFELSAAGMPPLLVYRTGENRIEEILIKGMPLGAHKQFPYEIIRMSVSPGDILFLMSDGYTELFNSDRVMLERELIEHAILTHAGCPAAEIVSALFEAGDVWRGTKAQDDDITFVVIKVR
jgi:serine phosphatase RsbU (regulator of sigma subunit)